MYDNNYFKHASYTELGSSGASNLLVGKIIMGDASPHACALI